MGTKIKQYDLKPVNPYRYNHKELTTDFGLDWYDYGARWYDASIGRFTGVDPIADQFAWVSPYNYAENEPVGHIDLWGLQKVSAKLAGELTLHNKTQGVVGALTYDIGNNGDFSLDLTFSSGLNWSAIYSKGSGFRQSFNFSKLHYMENMSIKSGIPLGDKLALGAINAVKNRISPKNLSDAMNLSSEELKMINITMYVLNSIEGLVKEGLTTVSVGYNGELGVANDGNADYVRTLTWEYSAEFDADFGDANFHYKGPVIFTYTEQENSIPQYIRRPTESQVGGSTQDNLRPEYWNNF